jgi:hypothetical protein
MMVLDWAWTTTTGPSTGALGCSGPSRSYGVSGRRERADVAVINGVAA